MTACGDLGKRIQQINKQIYQLHRTQTNTHSFIHSSHSHYCTHILNGALLRDSGDHAITFNQMKRKSCCDVDSNKDKMLNKSQIVCVSVNVDAISITARTKKFDQKYLEAA